ncbi:hypothetical protein [Streptomyces nigrescens]|uniref:hypothetical protein n=1 Tax=Streptomyces nigrescens TaxID=1920 RepID=UPI0030BA0F8A
MGSERSLVAVSLGPNRTKGDKDPAEWMPPAKDATCTYVADWVSAKLRWKLTVDRAERTKLQKEAAGCPGTNTTLTPAHETGPARAAPSGRARGQARPDLPSCGSLT